MHHSRTNHIHNSTVFSNISNHLDALANKVFSLEEAVSHSLLPLASTPDQSRLTQLQSLDFLRQSLEDLALMMHLIDTNTPNTFQHALPANEIAAKLKLASTKALVNGGPLAIIEDDGEASGDVDLF